MSDITPLCMPKWGLSMQEGTVTHWWKREGEVVNEGDEVADVETSKIANAYESPITGTLRRHVASVGEALPVGALLAVFAPSHVPDAEVDAFIAEFQKDFVPPAEDDAAEAALALSQVQAGDTTIQVGRRVGSEGRPPIVLVHGYASDLNSWLFNLEALADAGPVVALDLPGHGGSSKDVGTASLAELAAAVGATLDALDIPKAHLVGHSLGAAVVARLACNRPPLAASVTLICPAGLEGTTLNADFLRGVAEAQRARDLRPCLEQLAASPDAVTTEMVDNVLKAKRMDGAEEALERLAARLISGEDLADLRRDIDALPRTLVIDSAGDRIVGTPDPDRLPAQAEHLRIEGAGHLPHLEKAAEVNAAIVDFVRRS